MPPRIVRYPPIQCNTRERQAQSKIPIAPPAWRIPEGPESLAAVPVGGGRAWPGFEATRRAKLAARTASGRAAAHGRTKQPGPRDRPRGARNTSGTTSNKTGRQGPQRDLPWRRRDRRTWLRCPWAAAGPGRGAGRRRQGQGGPRDRPLRAKLACGDLAGGPPPTSTHSGQAQTCVKPRPADAGRGQPTQSGEKV